jgi:hypothetical protein
VSLDEIGPHTTGVTPDGPENNHDQVRHHALWGHLMAGGAGVEWYFGYEYPHSDLTAEDWRSRDSFWDQTRYALDFLRAIPFWEMESADELTDNAAAFVFARPGDVYAVYLPAESGSAELDVSAAQKSLTLRWFNPRDGQFEGDAIQFNPSDAVRLSPPSPADWVALIQ